MPKPKSPAATPASAPPAPAPASTPTTQDDITALLAVAALAGPRTAPLAATTAGVAGITGITDGQLTAQVQGDGSAGPDGEVTPLGPRHCGLIAIVGKPNVGKSTLLNALVGQKISITSRKAQTTRHRITGMRTQGATQFVFVDTPGFQTRHNNALNRSLNKTVQGAVADVDLVLLVVEAGMFNQADAKVLALLNKDIPTLLVANKLDQITRRVDIAPWLQDMQTRHPFAEFVPMSAKNAKDITRLLPICAKYLPEQDWIYAADELTDRNEKFLAGETVREKLFRLTGDELPYTSTVVIDKFEEEAGRGKQKRLVKIAATIVEERDGHKAIVIGDKGERIKRIGTETRVELEKLMDAKVFIELWVKVRSGWADDEARVRSFGYS